MPLYEYKCSACGRTFEAIQKFSDAPLTTDPECGGEVERLLSAPAFHFKGTGWYATDYAKKGSGEADAKSGEKSSGDKPKGEGKSSEGKSGESKSGEAKSKKDDAKPVAAESKPAA